MGYATSTDGLNWNRPDLANMQPEAVAKSQLPFGPHALKGSRTITRDPRPETPAERRFLGVRFTYEGELVSFSPDGIVWTDYEKNPVWHVPSDIIHVMWDDRRERFIAFYKVWEMKGREVRPDGPAEGIPFIAHMPTFTPKEVGNGTAQFDAPCITFNPPAAAKVENRQFVLRSGNQGANDGGGTSLSGEWHAKRVQAFAESKDGIHWTNEQVVLRADDKDTPSANIQYLYVISYGGYYLGFATLHDEAGYFQIQLAWSADGLTWHRPCREPWLNVGPEGAFDSGMVLGPTGPILRERDMWFPYGGFPIRHDSTATDWQSAIGLATMRLDGFASWQASDEPGVLVTQPFRRNGDRLFVNADAAGGSLAVEVLDENGAPVQGFEMSNCLNVTSDTLQDEKQGWIQWADHANLATLEDRVIQLKFELRNARLYAFRVADEYTVKLPTPRARTN
jgi:hypothetical protein